MVFTHSQHSNLTNLALFVTTIMTICAMTFIFISMNSLITRDLRIDDLKGLKSEKSNFESKLENQLDAELDAILIEGIGQKKFGFAFAENWFVSYPFTNGTPSQNRLLCDCL